MADEAVVRIVVTETGTPGPASGGAAPAPQPGRGTPLPPARDPNQTGGAAGGASAAPAPSTVPAAPPRDWVADLVRGIEGANRHVLIEGQSGSGKSLLTREIAFQRMDRGEEVHVVDTHNPETWGGAKSVFQGQQAGAEVAAFLKETLEARKTEAAEAKIRHEQPQFKDMTVVFSDFARIMKDSPQLQQEFKTLLTEARKFRISIIADTTAMTGAATGIKGIQDVIENFRQRVKLYAPTADDPKRKAETGGKTYDTPLLSEHKERIDYSLVKPYTQPPPDRTDEEDRERDAAASHARLLAQVERMDREARKTGEAEEADRLKRDANLRDALARQNKDAAREEAAQRRAGEVEEEARLKRDADIRGELLRQRVEAEKEAAKALKKIEDERREAEKEAAKATKEAAREAAREAAKAAKEAEQEANKRKRDRETEFDSIIKIVGSLRGTIGGVFGTVVGGALDVVSAVQRAKLDREKKLLEKTEADKKRQEQGETSGEASQIASRFKGMVGSTDKTTSAPKRGAGQIPSMLPTEAVSPEIEGGLMATAEAAVPIIGAVMAMKEAVHQINQAVIGGIRGAIGGVGGFAQAAADPSADPSVPLGKLGDAASSAGEVIADKFSPILGYATVVVGATVKALSGFMQALDQTAQRYAEYSAPIAQALAVAEVRQTLGDIRRAGEVSAEMTRYIAAQSDLQQKFEDVKVKLLVRIMPVATRILEMVEALVPSGEGIENAIRALINPLLLIPGIGDKLAAALHDELKPPPKDPTDELLRHGSRFDLVEDATGRGGFVPDR